MGAIVASRFGPAAFGQVQGLIGPFMTLGAFGAPFAGWIFDRTGSYDLALNIVLLIILPGAIAMVFLPQRKDQKPAASATTAPPISATLQADKNKAAINTPQKPGEQQNGTNPGVAGPSPGKHSVPGTTDRGSTSPPLAE